MKRRKFGRFGLGHRKILDPPGSASTRIVSFCWNFGIYGWRNGVSPFDFSSAAKDLLNLRGLSGEFPNAWSGFLMVMSTLGRFS